MSSLFAILALLLTFAAFSHTSPTSNDVPVPLPFFPEYFLNRIDMTDPTGKQYVETYVNGDNIKYVYHLSDGSTTTALQYGNKTFHYRNQGESCYSDKGSKLWNVLVDWNKDYKEVYSNGTLVQCGDDSLFYQKDECFVYFSKFGSSEFMIMQFWMRKDLHPVKIHNKFSERLIVVFGEDTNLGKGSTKPSDFVLPVPEKDCPQHSRMDEMLYALKVRFGA